MDIISERQLKQSKEQERLAGLSDLASVATMSPDKGYGDALNAASTQTDFKVIIEENEAPSDQASQTSDKLKNQTVEENYKETVELVKKYIKVQVPSLPQKKLRKDGSEKF